MHIDGASNKRGAGVGLILQSPQGDLIAQAVRCEFKATNNETEYEALILGLRLALDLGIRNLQRPERGCRCPGNSGGTFKPTELANIPIAHVLEPSIQKAEEIDRGELEDQQNVGVENGATVLSNTDDQSADPDWRTPYLDWLIDGKLPSDKKEERGFKMKASRFVLIDDMLFRKSLPGPYLRCLNKQEAQTVLHALHSGEYGNHAGGRSVKQSSQARLLLAHNKGISIIRSKV
ncbi:uncharacterized protein LOC141613491 [Silene latifolia]|uniref:uncharacterized protein LOC141613491 n=1 Tax=Silene latifolia TaxID=37657 RepID=UPI003D779C8C